MRVTVWNEFVQERRPDDPAHAVYPGGIHVALARGLAACAGCTVRTATLDEPEHGLTQDVLDTTDVLFWWAHLAHAAVDDAVVERVERAVHAGMGLVLLHSALDSKVFRRLLGTVSGLHGWRHGDRETMWTVTPSHPIARGVPQPLVLAHQEMYAEPFNIPRPDDIVFISSYSGGEVLRSGVTFTRGLGRIFYFAPGHEEYPVYENPAVVRILCNAAQWAARPEGLPAFGDTYGSQQRAEGWIEAS